MLPAPGATTVVCAYCQTATLIARPAPPPPAPPPPAAPQPRPAKRAYTAPAHKSRGTSAILGLFAMAGAAVYVLDKSLDRGGSLSATLASASAALAAALPLDPAGRRPDSAAPDAGRPHPGAAAAAKGRSASKSAHPDPGPGPGGLVPPPIVTASISGVELTRGSYDLAVVRTRLGSARGALAGCFSAVVADHPDSPRQLDLVFRINGDGSQSGIAPTNVNGGTELTSCVTRTLLRLKYAAPADGKTAELRCVVRFATAGAS
jgi:hypothetical protein